PAEVEDGKRGTTGRADPGLGVLKPSYGALQVVWVAPGSPAADAGIVEGDHVRRLRGKTLSAPSPARPARPRGRRPRGSCGATTSAGSTAGRCATCRSSRRCASSRERPE